MSNLKTRILEKYQLLRSKNLDRNFVENLNDWLRLELTYTSNAIEGNTLTRQETSLISNEGIGVGGKTVNEILEVKNHNKALDKIEEIAKRKKSTDLRVGDLLDLHRIILSGINDENAGKFRNVAVRIRGSQTILPNYMKVPILIDGFFKEVLEISNLSFIDMAIEAHYRIVTIHPFVDGNGRTARLFFNLILLQNQCPLCYIALEDGTVYLKTLEKAQTGGSKDDYTEFMYGVIERSLDLYLESENENKNGDEKKSQPTSFKIAELAKKSGEEISTIRHWIALELIKPFNKTAKGYALFTQVSVGKVIQIRNLQKKNRLTLKEIKDLLKN